MAQIISPVSVAPDRAFRIDDVNGDSSLVYIGVSKVGSADSDSNWQIRKLVKSGTVTSIFYPNGDSSFRFQWSNRTSYTYS